MGRKKENENPGGPPRNGKDSDNSNTDSLPEGLEKDNSNTDKQEPERSGEKKRRKD